MKNQKTKGAGTPFMATMLEERQRQYEADVRNLLEAPFIRRTNHGYEIDVVSLTNELSEKERQHLWLHLSASLESEK